VGGRGRGSALASPVALTTRRGATSVATSSPISVRSPILARSIPTTGLTTGVKVTVANLPSSVVVEDLQELFGGDGVKLKSVKMVSDGVSDVVFSRREDAVAAVSKYDNVLLDGRAMVLKMASSMPVARSARTPGTPVAGRLFKNAMQM